MLQATDIPWRHRSFQLAEHVEGTLLSINVPVVLDFPHFKGHLLCHILLWDEGLDVVEKDLVRTG